MHVFVREGRENYVGHIRTQRSKTMNRFCLLGHQLLKSKVGTMGRLCQDMPLTKTPPLTELV